MIGTRSTYVIGVIATPLVAAMVVAGCSSGSKSNASGSGTAATTASAVSTATSAGAGGSAAATSPANTAPTPSSGGDSSAGSAGVGACTLATAAEASTAYGEQFDAGKASTVGGDSSCVFTQSGGGIDTVGLVVATGTAADTFYSGNRAVYPGSDVSGIGDKAFVSTDGGEIIAEKGATAISVHLIGFEKDAPATLQAKQKAFAQVVIGHLK